jgi:LuxR family maltose regulon positive regulatory protein
MLAQLGSGLGDEPRAVLARVRVLLALERPSDALPLLDKLGERMRRNGLLGLWLSAMSLRCLALQASGGQREAVEGLGEVLAVAEPAGYVRLFLDGGREMAEMLGTAVGQNVGSEYTQKLLSLFVKIDMPVFPESQAESLSLSPRELEVLELVAQGLTNKEIAERLVIAPSTVKRHTMNIYNKLGVNNRAEATARAFGMGIEH